MNSRQKEVLEQSLKDEQAVLNDLVNNYTKALADIKKNIKELQANPLTQSKAYQLEFQKQLEQQISGILDNLQGKNFSSIAGYLQTCYETGFVGTAYDWQGQGVPLVIPIDEGQVIKAVEKTGDDFRLSNKLGVSTKELKQQVKTELQRGLATQLSYAEIARNISDYGQSNMNRSMLIARTEGHRVQSEARMDAMKAAKKKGADIVKQWDATLDGNTRQHHRDLDGQIRELDEPFEVAGMKVDCPGDFGIAAEDCNCRCCVLQRARWAVEKVDPDTGEVTEGKYQKWNNETGGFIETTGYQDFKEKYLKTAEPLKNTVKSSTIKDKSKNQTRYKNATSDKLESLGVTFNQVQMLEEARTTEEIVTLIGGGDLTSGSCASVALAYAGQKNGIDVLDFRGGDSMDFFSSKLNKVEMFKNLGVDSIVEDSFQSSIANGKKILKSCEVGKEYYLSVGRHAAIVRKTEDGVLQYLELQSASNNGWTNFNGNPGYTLQYRFGCSSSSRFIGTARMTDISQLKGNNEFSDILGYINTKSTDQKKGSWGHVR